MAATATSKKTQKPSAQATKVNVAEPILKRVKGAGWLSILESVIVGVLGGLLIFNGDAVVKGIFYIVGIFLMIKGVYKILSYFAMHGKYDFYNNDLLYGVIALVFGILAVVLWEPLGGVISIIIGVWTIYGALVRMNTAFKLHLAGVQSWFYVMVLSMIMLALGVYMVISYAAIFVVVGWVMIASAVVGIADDIIFIRNINQIA